MRCVYIISRISSNRQHWQHIHGWFTRGSEPKYRHSCHISIFILSLVKHTTNILSNLRSPDISIHHQARFCLSTFPVSHLGSSMLWALWKIAIIILSNHKGIQFRHCQVQSRAQHLASYPLLFSCPQESCCSGNISGANDGSSDENENTNDDDNCKLYHDGTPLISIPLSFLAFHCPAVFNCRLDCCRIFERWCNIKGMIFYTQWWSGHCVLSEAMLHVTPSRNAWLAMKLLSSLLYWGVIRRWIRNVDCLGLRTAQSQTLILTISFIVGDLLGNCQGEVKSVSQGSEWWCGMYNTVLTVSPLWSANISIIPCLAMSLENSSKYLEGNENTQRF